ncbi:MAG: hypothetical protein NVSMB52_13620 [Chloroflexota bacterium]
MEYRMDAQFLDIQAASALLGVPRKKVSSLVRLGILKAEPSVLDRRKKLIRRSDLEALLVREGRQPVVTVSMETPPNLRVQKERSTNEDEARELLKRTLKRVRRKGRASD